jgi:signal transduction histidine kinase
LFSRTAFLSLRVENGHIIPRHNHSAKTSFHIKNYICVFNNYTHNSAYNCLNIYFIDPRMNVKETSIFKFYARLSQLGIDKNTPEKLRKHVLLANSTNLTTISLIVPYTFLFYYLGLHKLAILLCAVFFLFSFYLYLAYKKHYFSSRTLMIVSMNIILGSYGIAIGKESDIHFLYFVFFTLPFLVYDLKNYMLIAVCCLSSVIPFLIILFGTVGPFVSMDIYSLKVISVAMTLVTFGWILLNKLYLINANRMAGEDLKESNRLLQSRNRDLEQFAYVASHDLQEPLRTVASYVELLDKQYSSSFDGNGRKYMDYILQSTYRLKNLIQDLLDYSRIGRNYRLQKIDMKLLVHETIADLEQLVAESNAAISVSNLPEAEGYSTDIKMLVQNLIVNALKFRRPEESPKVNVTYERVDGFWKFAVSDNGIGIEPQYRERIFIIFQRLHNQTDYEGNGIGLAHCKKIIEMHGGSIWADSNYGEGSTFYFTLPA